MTQPAPVRPNYPVPVPALPEPGYPMITRMISNPIFSESGAKDDPAILEPIIWVVGNPHPFVPKMKITRMFLDRGGVEVYSAPDNREVGMRNLIPMSWVRFVEEAMPIEIFIAELAAAESDDPEDDPEEPEELKPAPVAVPNGQVISSS
jgi:hypothetical protein